MSQRLQGKIAVVAGADHGNGRAIATALADEGATVYLTGQRSSGVHGAAAASGAVEETAALISARGGTGVPLLCDHGDDDEIASLFLRVRREQGRLDLLVNNLWEGVEELSDTRSAEAFWEAPDGLWDDIFTAVVRAHLGASRRAAPLMIPRRAGLIVNMVSWSFGDYLGGLYCDIARAACIRMAYGIAHELRRYEIAAVAIDLGPTHHGPLAGEDQGDALSCGRTASARRLGQAIAALAADTHIVHRSGSILTVDELAREYGFDIERRSGGSGAAVPRDRSL